jgi:hypothetical protein
MNIMRHAFELTAAAAVIIALLGYHVAPATIVATAAMGGRLLLPIPPGDRHRWLAVSLGSVSIVFSFVYLFLILLT